MPATMSPDARRLAMLLGLTVLFGAAWTLLRLWTGSLWPGLLSHLLWDWAVMAFWPLATGN